MRSTPVPAFLVLLASLVPAQLPEGTIAVIGAAAGEFATVSPAGIPTVHTLPVPFPTVPISILRDASSGAFFVGGVGWIGRITFSTPTNFTFTVLNSATGRAELAGIDASGRLVYAEATSDQIKALNLTTLAVTFLTTGAQSWGTNLGPAVVDLHNQRLYAATTTGSLFRMSNSGGALGAEVLIATALGVNVNDLTIDPFDCSVVSSSDGQIIANPPSFVSPKLVRVSPTGAASNLFIAPLLTGVRGVAIDEHGDFIVARSQDAISHFSDSIPSLGFFSTVSTGMNSTSIAGCAVVRNTTGPAGPQRLDIFAPAAGSVTLRVQGFSGNFFDILVSLVPAIPTGSGFLFGVNGDALGQIFAPVFAGDPSACGGAKIDVLNLVPPGITIDAVALDTNNLAVLLGVSNVLTFTTL